MPQSISTTTFVEGALCHFIVEYVVKSSMYLVMSFGSKGITAILNEAPCGSRRSRTIVIGELERYKTICNHLFRDEGYIARTNVKFTAINGGVGE